MSYRTHAHIWGVALMVLSGQAALVHADPEDPLIQQKEQKLDEEASTTAGAERVTQQLATEFGVDTSKVQALRDQQLGYGEIHHAMTLAQQLNVNLGAV